jgi:hypothetical protein
MNLFTKLFHSQDYEFLINKVPDALVQSWPEFSRGPDNPARCNTEDRNS